MLIARQILSFNESCLTEWTDKVSEEKFTVDLVFKITSCDFIYLYIKILSESNYYIMKINCMIQLLDTKQFLYIIRESIYRKILIVDYC